MSRYTYIHIKIRIFSCVCTHSFKYTPIYPRIHMHTWIYPIHTCIHIHMYLYLSISICIYLYDIYSCISCSYSYL